MYQSEIANCRAGRPFLYINDDGDDEELPAVASDELEQHVNLYETIELCGLPNANGWINETEELIKYYKLFKTTYETTKKHIELKAAEQHG